MYDDMRAHSHVKVYEHSYESKFEVASLYCCYQDESCQ